MNWKSLLRITWEEKEVHIMNSPQIQSFIHASDQLASQLMPVALALLGIGFTIHFGRYVTGLLIDFNFNTGLMSMGGVIILAIAVASYNGTIHPVVKSAATGLATALPEQPQLEEMLDFGDAYEKKKSRELERKKELQRKKREEGTSTMVGEFFQKLKDDVGNNLDYTFDISWVSIATNWFATGLTMLTRMCIEWLGVILMAIVLAFAPVALGLSSIPGFGGVRQQIISLVIGIACWPLTMRGLDFILIKVSQSFKTRMLSDLDSSGDNMEFILINVIMCVCYIIVPMITSWYTGAASGAFLSKVAGVSALSARSAIPGALNAAGGVSRVAATSTALGTKVAGKTATHAVSGIAGASKGAARGLQTGILVGQSTGSSRAAIKAGFSVGWGKGKQGYQSAMDSRLGKMAQKGTTKTSAAISGFGKTAQKGTKQAGEKVKNAIYNWERYVT